jgi:signal transduction histidine kinase
MAHNLMPEILQQEGLEQAIQLFCKNVCRGGKPEVVFETVGYLPKLPDGVELSVYRITQELLHNVIKHAAAGRAVVQLVYANNRLGLTIEDDGVGFNSNEGMLTGGMGLHTIHNRVKSLGGTMDISSLPGDGTSIYIEFAISKNENT